MWTSKVFPAALTLAVFSVLSGCAGRYAVGYTAYDPYYYDYHPWVGPEPGYYNDWIIETHRPHRDYRRLRPEEQREYWQWRHQHHPEPAGRPGRAGPQRR